MTDREERVETIYQGWGAREMTEEIVDLRAAIKLNDDHCKSLTKALIQQELDPSRLESALRMYVSELDYDIHKMLEFPEDGRPDQYPGETQFFLRCWETAGDN